MTGGKDNYLLERFHTAIGQSIDGILEPLVYDGLADNYDLLNLTNVQQALFKNCFSQMRTYMKSELTDKLMSISETYQTD